jgi:hypothetical protein
VADGQLVVIDQLAFEKPRTKEIIRILRNVGIERSTLVVTSQSDRTVIASIRNLPKTKALPAAYLNVVDMLNHQGLLITEDAVRVAEQLWGQKEAPKRAAPARKPAGKARAPKATAKAEVTVEAPPEAEEAPKAPRPRKAAPKAAAPAKEEKPAAKARASGLPRRPRRRSRRWLRLSMLLTSCCGR